MQAWKSLLVQRDARKKALRTQEQKDQDQYWEIVQSNLATQNTTAELNDNREMVPSLGTTLAAQNKGHLTV